MAEISVEQMLEMFEVDLDGEGVQNAFLYPVHPFRLLACGKSSSGKSTAISLALVNHKIKFDKLYLYARHLHQDKKYMGLIKHLKSIVKSINETSKYELELNDILHVASTYEEMLPVDDLDPDCRNLVWFDDFLQDKNANILALDYFIRGRHMNASIIYCTQGYFAKQLPVNIRNNCNYFMLCKNIAQNNTLDRIARDLGHDPKEFLEKFEIATKDDNHSFVLVDTIHSNPDYQIRKNWDMVFQPN